RPGVGMGGVLPGRRGAGQSHGLAHGGGHELRGPHGPSLRPGFPGGAVSQSAPRVFVAVAAADRYEGRALDDVQDRPARAELTPAASRANNIYIVSPGTGGRSDPVNAVYMAASLMIAKTAPCGSA